MARTSFSSSSSSESVRCPLCSNTFTRNEHLQRHLASHAATRPFTCGFCSHAFKRRDILKRHYTTCRLRIRSGLQVSQLSDFSPPSKRRACDRCARLKRACSSVHFSPCEACLARNDPCTFNINSSTSVDQQTAFDQVENAANEGDFCHDIIAVSDSGSAVSLPGGFIQHMMSPASSMDPWSFLTDSSQLSFDFSSDMDWQDLHIPASLPSIPPYPLDAGSPAPSNLTDQDPVQSFHFLALITSTTGFLNSFDCGTLLQRQQVIQSWISSTSLGDPNTLRHTEQPFEYPRTENMGTSFSYADTQSFDTLDSLQASWISDPLALQTHEIVHRIKEVSVFGQRNSAVTTGWSALLEEMCLRFFAPPNILKFLHLYWATWYPNMPSIHKPTFDPKTASPLLIAAMVLIAACMSPDEADKDNANIWFNAVEEMTFGDECFGDNSFAAMPPGGKSPSLATWKRRLQTIQAAYAVCLYQNWEGSDVSKRRVRRYRFSTVVAAARDLDIANARHMDLSAIPAAAFDWAHFVIREEMIRTLIYIFLLDTAFVIFNNVPPRMVVRELQMDLVCPEPCFQAATAKRCYHAIQSWIASKAWHPGMSLGSAIEAICQKDLSGPSLEMFSHMGTLNLFTITSAFHSLIFHLQTSFGYEPQLAPVRTALANWKTAWMGRRPDSKFATPANPATNSVDSSSANHFHGAAVPSASPPLSNYNPVASSSSTTAKTSSSASATASTNPSPPSPAAQSMPSFTPRTMWKRIGFMRNAPEYWLLSRIVLDRLEAQVEQSQKDKVNGSALGLGPFPGGKPRSESVGGSRQGTLGIGFGGPGAGTGGMGFGGLGFGLGFGLGGGANVKYDETSMSQVAELITEFQKVNLRVGLG